MIIFLKTWVNQIIVAIIISTIIEMILPNGNNKKYIKMVIGLYILFTIIQPIFTKITGEKLNISGVNYNKYFNTDILETTSQDFETNNSKLIKQAYIDNIKQDIKSKINKKGYDLTKCSIDILDDESKEGYGAIQNISLKIKKKESKIEESTNLIKIENIEVGTNSNSIDRNTEDKSKLSDDEKIEIIEYLAKEYSIDKTIITIN